MHLLSSRPGGFVEDDSIITRLDQTPADMVVLSSADTTLSLLADAYRMWLQAEPRAAGSTPTLRLANLLHLRQSASLDLYIDQVLQHARLIIVDHLGAESTWPYGIEQLQSWRAARARSWPCSLATTRKIPNCWPRARWSPSKAVRCGNTCAPAALAMPASSCAWRQPGA